MNVKGSTQAATGDARAEKTSRGTTRGQFLRNIVLGSLGSAVVAPSFGFAQDKVGTLPTGPAEGAVDSLNSLRFAETFTVDPGTYETTTADRRTVFRVGVSPGIAPEGGTLYDWRNRERPRAAALFAPSGAMVAQLWEVAVPDMSRGGVPSLTTPREVKILTPPPESELLFVVRREQYGAAWQVKVAVGPDDRWTTVLQLQGEQIIAPRNKDTLMATLRGGTVKDLWADYGTLNNLLLPPPTYRLALAALAIAVQSARDEEKGILGR